MARPTFSLPLAALALAVALAVSAMPAGPGARAQALCSNPVEPICATAIPATEPSPAVDQGLARNRCIEDAEAYREKLEEYRQCLDGSVAKAKASLKAADDFIQCLATGKPDCRLRDDR